eukprot:GHVL01038117.1.p1 GENE.GHVL01038117.1~~GHVL01038117.1.p1  ORF type:complete len:129 (+),score=27.47 GHVL01038117.1:57-443(+)
MESNEAQLRHEISKSIAQRNQLVQRIQSLQEAQKDHSLVADALKAVECSRRCYRLVGGVLVEQTAGTVLPVIESNLTEIQDRHKQMKSQLDDVVKILSAMENRLGSDISKHDSAIKKEEIANSQGVLA